MHLGAQPSTKVREEDSPVSMTPSGGHPISGHPISCLSPAATGAAEGTEVVPGVVATAAVRAETLHLSRSPPSGPAAAQCLGTLSSYLGSCCFLLE